MRTNHDGRLFRVGLCHALDTGGISRRHNLQQVDQWRQAIGRIPGCVVLAPWVDVALSDPDGVDRRRIGWIQSVLMWDAKTLEFCDVVVVVRPALKSPVWPPAPGFSMGEAPLSEGQTFEVTYMEDKGIPHVYFRHSDLEAARNQDPRIARELFKPLHLGVGHA